MSRLGYFGLDKPFIEACATETAGCQHRKLDSLKFQWRG